MLARDLRSSQDADSDWLEIMMSRLMIVLATIVCLWAVDIQSAWAGPGVSVPEPSSLALLAVGLGGAALLKFRRRK